MTDHHFPSSRVQNGTDLWTNLHRSHIVLFWWYGDRTHDIPLRSLLVKSPLLVIVTISVSKHQPFG
jgi:hypothetical protein